MKIRDRAVISKVTAWGSCVGSSLTSCVTLCQWLNFLKFSLHIESPVILTDHV